MAPDDARSYLFNGTSSANSATVGPVGGNGLSNNSIFPVTAAGVAGAANGEEQSAQCASVTTTPLGLAGPPTNVVINFDPDVSNSTAPGYQSVDLEFVAPTEIDRMTSTGWFYFKVCAVNAVGAGPFTSAVTLVAEIVPNAVVRLAASNLDANGNHAPSTATVSWGYDIDNSTPLLGYIIAYLDTSDTGLTNGNGYSYVIGAVNANGEGPRSTYGGEYPSTVPNTPTNIGWSDSNAHGSGQELTISWSQSPSDQSINGGSAISQFNVRDVN
eukprot:gene24790-31168_t